MLVVPDISFPSDNLWDIPVLDIQQQPVALPTPFLPWGCRSRRALMSGTWHFYLDDEKFQRLWNAPTGILASSPTACVEPNFTIPPDCDRAAALFQIYRKRFCSRFWQSQGVLIFVDLFVPVEFNDLNTLGVPDGWNAYATRGSGDIDRLMQQWAIAQSKSGRDNPLFVVYAGGKKVEQLAYKYGWLYFDTYRGEH